MSTTEQTPLLEPSVHNVQGGPESVFSSVDHGADIPRPELVAEDPELVSPDIPEPEADCHPLADTFVALTAMGCRMLDPDNPITDPERAELVEATAALERRYAPSLANAGDAILWARFSITMGVLVQPRAGAFMERRKAENEAAAARESREVRQRQDLRPVPPSENEDGGLGD